MGSTFGTYSIAYSGMYVNQASLATASTNLANIDTTGASKVQLSSAEQDTVQSNGTSTGNGVSVASITRSRDIYLDSTYRTQNAEANYLSVKNADLEYMDEILSEYDTTSSTDSTSSTGVEASIEDFFAAWQTLSTDSGTSSSTGMSAQATFAAAIATAASGTTSTAKTAVTEAYSAYTTALTSGSAATIVSTKTTLDSDIAALDDTTLTAALTTYNTSSGTAINTDATALTTDITNGATALATLSSAVTTATSGTTSTAKTAVTDAYSAYTTALTSGVAATIVSTKTTLDSAITALADSTLTSAYSTYNSATDGGTTINAAAAAVTAAVTAADADTATAATTRAAVTAAGAELISTLTGIDQELQQLQTDAVTGVKDGVDSLNDLAGQVAELDKQITQAESGGGEASYLRDQRDVLLDEMSALANISITESKGTLTVTLGGATLVDGDTTNTLTVEGSGTTDDPLTVKWVDSDSKATINSGSIKGYLEEADQTGYESIDSSDIPYDFTTSATSSISTLRQGLNDLITTLAAKINSLSSSGVDLDGNAGLDFFTAIDSSQPLSITNIEVNPELVSDSSKVVASSSDEAGDNTVASEVCDLESDTACYKSSSSPLDIIDFYATLTDWIGTAGDTASSNYTTQTALVDQVDTQRQSVSSISIDEEMSNMIKFQNAYAASAKVMSTIDTMLADLLDAF
ncbi:MAG: flagellar hook-associated protein FlgK [Veillonellales bacterium]